MTEREAGLARVGVQLRKWRLDEKLSQKSAARRIGASQPAWAAWERGEKGPDLHYAFEIEKLTKARVRANDWAFPRATTRAVTEAKSA